MDKELAKEKTIKRMLEKSDLKISKTQKDAAKKWIGLLEEKELKAEKSNNLLFMKLILNDILGYSFEETDYEKKNVEFSFSKDGKRRLVIETKGTKTDLKKPQLRQKGEHSTPIKQLFDYMSSDATKYGVLTNYRTFMLFGYKEGREKYYEFDFLSIKNNPDKLKEFILIFSKSTLIDEKKVEKIKLESEIEERKLTDKFYKLFHETRLMLLKEFEENKLDREQALYSAQLFLNRLMFVFFAEDINLIPPKIFEESLIKSLESYSENTSNCSNNISVLFDDLDKGASSKEIQQFNGGLFKEKLSRDAYFNDLRKESFFERIYSEKKNLKEDIRLSEEDFKIFSKAKKDGLSPIIENLLLMVSFDFKSDLKVNILGHIFEQSLSDLEDLKNENISKRKKDGIFYTPEYITDYICRNTIVPYLSKSGTNDVDKLIEEYSKDLDVLEEKFSNIKILDPACGSGAFLIKAVDVLFEIFEKIQNLKQSYGEYSASRGLKAKSNIKGQVTFKKFEEKDKVREIIENNIYGVDLNEESIETTKLSLFLRIAKKGKKLPDLSEHIKCGNSLIDDEEVAGEKAFDWDKEFPFKFDVVIGNPPYGAKMSEKEVNYVKKNYSFGTSETAQLMMENSKKFLKVGGFNGFIVPKAFTFVSTWDKIRKDFLGDLKVIIDCKKVWKEVKLEQIIYIIEKGKESKEYESGILESKNIKIIANVDKSLISKFDGILLNSLTNQEIKIGSKIKEIKTRLKDFGKDGRGDLFYQQMNDDGKGFKVLGGNEIQRYYQRGIKGYIEDKYIKSDLSKIKSNSILLQRIIAHIENPIDHLRIAGTIFENENYRIVDTIYQIVLDKEISNKYVLAIINSNFMNWFVYRFVFAKAIRSFQFSGDVAKKIPIPKISLTEQKPFIEKADEMLKLNKEFYDKKNKFLIMLKSNATLKKVSKKLDNFYLLSWADFEKELQKQKIFLKGSDKDDWFDRFSKYQKELSSLKEKIDATDKEIDEMVYALYGLTEKEIKIVEESLG